MHFHHHLQKRSSTHRGFHLSILPATDDCSGNLDEAEQPLGLSSDLVFSPERCRQDLPAREAASSTTQGQDHPQGLGCGGLPA